MIELAKQPMLRCNRCGVHNDYTASDQWCHGCGAQLVAVGDGLPTMGEQAESELSSWACTCGEPDMPGVVHRQDKPCYYLERTNDS